MLSLFRRSPLRSPPSWHAAALRSFSSAKVTREAQRTDYDAKYATKLQQRAKEQGKSLSALRALLKEREREKLQRLKEEREKAAATSPTSTPPASPSTRPISSASSLPGYSPVRKDSLPIKPLSSILNLDKILETPHTREQLSELWIAYHQSRSSGTGRGYVCAVVDVVEYEAMLDTALKYPTFVVPFPVQKPPQENENASLDELPPCVFYMLQWAFHGSPPEPTRGGDLFSPPRVSANPQTSTILFTPLQEYKLRQAFATPFLVVTNYTDLAESHGVVLLHGEITPFGASADVGSVVRDGGRYMLTQEEAQMLAIQLQRFYLWRKGQDVKLFNENPAEFDWKDLLKPLS